MEKKNTKLCLLCFFPFFVRAKGNQKEKEEEEEEKDEHVKEEESERAREHKKWSQKVLDSVN